MVPLLVTLALSYAADLLERLRREGERSERLGGRLEIASPRPEGHGTAVRLDVPLPRRLVIRVLLVDDHPALRAGLQTVLRLEPGMIPVGAAADGEAALEEARRWEPGVVLVDYHLPGENGLVLCERLTGNEPAPRVLLYSAYADASLAVPARIAGADGIANKGAPAEELLEAIRMVAKGRPLFPSISPETIEASAARLPGEDREIFELLMDRTPSAEVAAALGLDEQRLRERVRTMLRRLGPATN